MIVHAIVAVGNQGQIGLNDGLPWKDPEDLKWFQATTMSHFLVAGHNTFEGLPELPGRTVFKDNIEMTVAEMIAYLESQGAREVFIIGGSKTYERWKSYINRWYVSRIDYNGEADTYIDIGALING